jgi:hypothetical protein
MPERQVVCRRWRRLETYAQELQQLDRDLVGDDDLGSDLGRLQLALGQKVGDVPSRLGGVRQGSGRCQGL